MLEKFTPEKIERAKQMEVEKREWALVKAFEKGLDDEDSTLGYHGASLEAVQFLIREGHLPGRTGDTVQADTQHEKGYLYFYPAREEDDPSATPEMAANDAASYAESIAGEHSFMKKLNLDFADADLRSDVREFVIRAASLRSGRSGAALNRLILYDKFIEMGISPKDLEEAVNEAIQRKGVILALDIKLLTSHKVEDAYPDAGYRIQIPEGLKASDIIGLDPKSQVEWNFFEELQKKKGG